MISSIVVGIPYAVLEGSLGQWMKEGGIGAWNLVPIFKGTISIKFSFNSNQINFYIEFSFIYKINSLLKGYSIN